MRLTPADSTDSVQLLNGAAGSAVADNSKSQIELKLGDKAFVFSTGTTEQGQEQCIALYHVLFFTLNGFHPSFPPPASLAWNLPLLFGYLNGGFARGLFEREAVYQGIPEEIRPWVWKKLSEALLSGTLVLDSADMATLTAQLRSLPQRWESCIAKQAVSEPQREVLRLLCKYLCISMISLHHSHNALHHTPT